MPIGTTIQEDAVSSALADKLSYLAPALLRLTLGWCVHPVWLGQAAQPDKITEYFDSLHIPMPGLNRASRQHRVLSVGKSRCWSAWAARLVSLRWPS